MRHALALVSLATLVVLTAVPAPSIAQGPEFAGEPPLTWTTLPPIRPRHGHVAIHDPVRHRLLVFGGYEGVRRNELWALALDGSNAWTLVATLGTPPTPRYQHAAIYDPVGDRMIVIGGDDGQDRSDVWALALGGTPTWSSIVPNGTPPPGRYGHSALYDAPRSRVVMFGGRADSVVFADTWELSLDGAMVWTEVVAGGPAPRYRHAAIVDALESRMIVHGGRTDTGMHADLWAFSLVENAWQPLPATGPTPYPMEGQLAVYDPTLRRMVVLHEMNRWTLDLDGPPEWTAFAAPATPTWRYRGTFTYDPVAHRAIAFGGDTYTSRTDALALSSLTWSTLATDVSSGWNSATMIYDPMRDRMLLFGGSDRFVTLATTWELPLDGPLAWRPLVTVGEPPSRVDHSAIYDPVRDRMIVFSGWHDPAGPSNGTVLADVWELSLGGVPTWLPMAISGAPAAGRQNHTAIYDPVRDRMVVFGGRGAASHQLVALSLSGTPTWTFIDALNPLPTRFHHSAIYDADGDRMIVVGGEDGIVHSTGAYALDLGAQNIWTELPNPPFLRRGHDAFYDPIADRMIVGPGIGVGGFSTDLPALALDEGGDWSTVATTSYRPIGTTWYASAYDPRRDRWVFTGGFEAGRYHWDTWLLERGTPIRPEVTCEGPLAWQTADALEARYVVTNPIGDDRVVEWTLASDRAWPGYPKRGSLHVAHSETLAVPIAVPDTVAEGGNVLRLQVAFAGAAGNTGICDRALTIHTTAVNDPVVPGLALLGVQPNPSTRPVVAFTLPFGGPVRIECFEIGGRRVAAQESLLGAGTHRVRAFGHAALRPGVYLVRLSFAGRQLHARAVVLR